MVKTNVKQTPVKGGFVSRSAKTGRFISVRTSDGVAWSRPKTVDVVKEASSKRRAALQRLADR